MGKINSNSDVIFAKEINIRSYEADANGRFSMPAVCNHLQDIAWEHAHKLGFGYEQLGEQDLFWVLSRLKIEVEKFPLWNEKVIVRTWPRGTERLFAYRDYVIEDKHGNLLIAATSAWLILDKDKHRPQKYGSLESAPVFPDSKVKEPKLAKLPELENGKPGEDIKVLFSDLDVNKHVNNSRYIKWLLDSYKYDENSLKEIRSLEINFLAEALLNDKVAVLISPVNRSKKEYLQSIRRRNDNKEIVRARIKWD